MDTAVYVAGEFHLGDWREADTQDLNRAIEALETAVGYGLAFPEVLAVLEQIKEWREARWVVYGDLRRYDGDWRNNDAPDQIGPMSGIEYDPEVSMFWAYADDEDDARALVAAIEAEYGIALDYYNEVDEG